MLSKLLETIDVLFFFGFIFGAQFSFLPVSTSKLMLVLCAGMDFFFFMISPTKNCIAIKKKVLKPLFFFALMLFGAVLMPIAYGTSDFNFTYAIVLLLIEDFFGSILFCIYLYKRGKLTVDYVIKLYIDICFIQAVIILSMLLVPSVRDLIFSVQKIDLSGLNERYGGIRGFGLAASTTYDLAVVLSVALIFIAGNFLTNKMKNTAVELVKFVIIFAAMLITGRTGFIGVGIACLLFAYKIPKLSPLNKFRCVLIFLGMIIISVYLFNLFVPKELKELIINYAFEVFINLAEKGKASSTSTDVLKTMYFSMPLETFFLGDGRYIDPLGGYYMHTDAGYMRQVLFFGLFFSMAIYFLYLYLAIDIRRNIHKQNSPKYGNILFIVFLYFFLVNYKGDLLIGCRMTGKLCFMFYSLFYISTKQKKNYSGLMAAVQ